MIIRSTRTGLSRLYVKPVPEWVFQDRTNTSEGYLIETLTNIYFLTSAWLRMSVLLSTLAPVVVLSFLIFFATVAKPLTIIGHRCSNSDWYFVTEFGRGHPALLPEHSEPGYISAIEHGADFIECDVHFTRWLELLTLWERQLITVFSDSIYGGEGGIHTESVRLGTLLQSVLMTLGWTS